MEPCYELYDDNCKLCRSSLLSLVGSVLGTTPSKGRVLMHASSPRLHTDVLFARPRSLFIRFGRRSLIARGIACGMRLESWWSLTEVPQREREADPPLTSTPLICSDVKLTGGEAPTNRANLHQSTNISALDALDRDLGSSSSSPITIQTLSPRHLHHTTTRKYVHIFKTRFNHPHTYQAVSRHSRYYTTYPFANYFICIQMPALY